MAFDLLFFYRVQIIHHILDLLHITQIRKQPRLDFGSCKGLFILVNCIDLHIS